MRQLCLTRAVWTLLLSPSPQLRGLAPLLARRRWVFIRWLIIVRHYRVRFQKMPSAVGRLIARVPIGSRTPLLALHGHSRFPLTVYGIHWSRRKYESKSYLIVHSCIILVVIIMTECAAITAIQCSTSASQYMPRSLHEAFSLELHDPIFGTAFREVVLVVFVTHETAVEP